MHFNISSTNWWAQCGKVASLCLKRPNHTPIPDQSHPEAIVFIGNDDLTITGSYNGLVPSRRQTIIWTNAGI